MKLYKTIMSAFLFGTLCLASGCDNISDDDRFIPEDKPVLPPHAVPKTLLIQEFTGLQCTNCPKGAETVHNIMENNPGRVVAVGLQPYDAGPNTLPFGPYDYRSDAATVIFKYYGSPSSFPSALFNGSNLSSQYLDWATIASQCLTEEAFLTIDATTDYDNESRNLKVDYTLTFSGDYNEPISIMAWVIENHIIGYQLDGGKHVLDYEHNHLLRASMNGDWGTDLGTNIKNGDVKSGTASLVLSDKWNADNCQVVLYVFKNSSKVVEQTAVFDAVASQTPEETDK